MRKGFSGIFLVLGTLVFASVIGFLYLSKTSFLNNISKTSNYKTVAWKTYKNSRYNYSIKYPPDWHVIGPRMFDPLGSGNVRIAYLSDKVSQLPSENQALLDIIVEAIPDNKIPTKQWYQEEWVKHIPAGIDTSKYILEETTFAGLPALKVNENEIIFTKDKNLFMINWSSPQGNYKTTYEEDINLMLSSFKLQ